MPRDELLDEASYEADTNTDNMLSRGRRLRKPCQESRRPKAAERPLLVDGRTGRIVFGLFDRGRLMYIPPMRRPGYGVGGRAALSLHIWRCVFQP